MPDFTEGEWEYWKHEKFPYWYVGRKGSERFIATVDKEANARLIAAAPEMYELLKEELIPTSDYGGILSFSREDKLRKLFARIDGKEANHMNEELKPCPFCGGKAEICTKLDEGYRYFWVRCVHCCAYTLHVSTPETAVKGCNRRAGT